jgi:biopolymer transport protein ExbD
MSFSDNKKKKRRWFKSLLILVLLILLLILLDGRFGIGDGLFLNTPSETQEDETSGDASKTQSTILINDNNIIYENESILIVTLEEIISEAPDDHLFILVDEMANNSLFESVEKLLKDSGRMYTIE